MNNADSDPVQVLDNVQSITLGVPWRRTLVRGHNREAFDVTGNGDKLPGALRIRTTLEYGTFNDAQAALLVLRDAAMATRTITNLYGGTSVTLNVRALRRIRPAPANENDSTNTVVVLEFIPDSPLIEVA